MDDNRFLPHYTYQDYLQWEGNWELIDGIPHAMSPAPHPEHQRITANLNAEFRFALKKCKTCKVYEPLDYKIGEETVLQPDILVVCGEINKQYLDFPPALVVETLSPATASKDRMYKFNVYRQQGISYFLIVDIEKKEIEIYRLEDDMYELVNQGKDFSYEFTFSDDCRANIDFKEIWL